ncbi:MAG TPA: ABC transporter permease [Acetobacteraceae bacterium]|nr:ABC transporter permease [Acetobacteraceae bacterium]
MASGRLAPHIDWELPTRLASALVFLLAWQIAASLAQSRLLPTVTAVLRAMVQQTISGALPWNLAITLGRVAAAFTVSLLLGSALGIAMGRWRRLDLLLDNAVTVLLNLPALVVIVLIYVWFGLNEIAAIAAVALNKLPTTVVTLREGARALDPGLAEMAQSFHMTRWRTLRHVTLPQLTPYVFAAARSGLALIWKIVLVVELLGRSNGVGFQIQIYFQLFDVTLILAYTLAFIVVVQLIEWAGLQPLERWATRWRR